MAYKKCLIATTKNLFDISKATKLQNSSFKDAATDKYAITSNGYWTTLTAWQNGTYGTNVGVNLSAGTYTYSADVESELGKISLVIYTSSNVIYSGDNILVVNNEVYRSFTLETDSTVYFGLVETGNSSHTSAKCTVTNIQFEKGSTATSYVPYGYLPSYKKIIKVNNNPVQLLDKSKYESSLTRSGITFTNNNDGTVTANGTATANVDFGLFGSEYNYTEKLLDGKYLILGCPSNGGENSYRIYIQGNYGSSYSPTATDTGSGAFMNYSSNSYPNRKFGCWITIISGYTANNLIFKPQLYNLTAMFGVGHEPSTVAEFRAKYPNDYYEYNPSQYLISYRKNLITDGSSKNLFDIPLTQGYPSDKNYGASTKRTFTIGTYITGFARNNYYDPDNITNVNVSKGIISFKVADASGYGIGIPILLTAGQTYTASCLVDNNVRPGIGISYYKEDGTPISYTQGEMVTNNPIVSFTIPEGTYFTVVVLYGQSNNNYVFSNIQLEKGNAATSYVPYQYL